MWEEIPIFFLKLDYFFIFSLIIFLTKVTFLSKGIEGHTLTIKYRLFDFATNLSGFLWKYILMSLSAFFLLEIFDVSLVHYDIFKPVQNQSNELYCHFLLSSYYEVWYLHEWTLFHVNISNSIKWTNQFSEWSLSWTLCSLPWNVRRHFCRVIPSLRSYILSFYPFQKPSENIFYAFPKRDFHKLCFMPTLYCFWQVEAWLKRFCHLNSQLEKLYQILLIQFFFWPNIFQETFFQYIFHI